MATPISSEGKQCRSRKVLVGDLRRDTRRPATSAIAGFGQTACRAQCRKKTSRAEVAVGTVSLSLKLKDFRSFLLENTPLPRRFDR